MFLVLAAGLALLQNLGSISCRYIHIDDSNEINTGARLTTASPTGPIAHLIVPLHGRVSNLKKKDIQVKVIPYRDIEKKQSMNKDRKLYNYDKKIILDNVKGNDNEKDNSLMDKKRDIPVVLVAAKKTKLRDDEYLHPKRKTEPDQKSKLLKYYKKVILLPDSSLGGSTDGSEKSDIATKSNEDDKSNGDISFSVSNQNLTSDYSGSDVDVITSLSSESEENSGDTASIEFSIEHNIPNKTKQKQLLGSLKKNLKDGRKALQSFYRKLSNSKIKFKKRRNGKEKAQNKRKKAFMLDDNSRQNKDERETDSNSNFSNEGDLNKKDLINNLNDITAALPMTENAILPSSSDYDVSTKADENVGLRPEKESYEINDKVNKDSTGDITGINTGVNLDEYDSSDGYDLGHVRDDSDIYSGSDIHSGYTDYTSEDNDEGSDSYFDSKTDTDDNLESINLSNIDQSNSVLGSNSYILDSQFNSAESEGSESVNINIEPIPAIIGTSDSSDVVIGTNKDSYEVPRKFQRDFKKNKDRYLKYENLGKIIAGDEVEPSNDSIHIDENSDQFKEIEANVRKDGYEDNLSTDGGTGPSDDSVSKEKIYGVGKDRDEENIPMVEEPADSSVYIDQNSGQYKKIDSDVRKNIYYDNISKDGQVKPSDTSIYIDQNSAQYKEITANYEINKNDAITLSDNQMNISSFSDVDQDSQQYVDGTFNVGKIYKSKESDIYSESERDSEEDNSSCCDDLSKETVIKNEKDDLNSSDVEEPTHKTLLNGQDSERNVDINYGLENTSNTEEQKHNKDNQLRSDSTIYIHENPAHYVEIKSDDLKHSENNKLRSDSSIYIDQNSAQYVEISRSGEDEDYERKDSPKEDYDKYIIEALPENKIKKQSTSVRKTGNHNKLKQVEKFNKNVNAFEVDDIERAVVRAVAKYIATLQKNQPNGVKNLKSYNLSFVFNK